MVQNGEDGSFKDFEIWVKPEFLTLCDVQKVHIFDMFKDHKLFDYLHNDAGPAIVNHQNGEVNYIINGKPATEEEIERIKHNVDFNGRLNTEIKA